VWLAYTPPRVTRSSRSNHRARDTTNQIEDTAEEQGISEQAVVEDVMLGQARTKEMMTPAEAATLFVSGFSRHGKHLNGGGLP
jgi:hypothetical protein